MYRLKSLIACALFLALISACGLRGPLYLPEAGEAAQQTENEGSETEEQESKDEENEGPP